MKPMTTKSRLRRSLVLAAATVVAAAAGSLPATVSLLPATPAGAATAVDCSAGVIVAVDFSSWGGNTDAVCDTILPANAAYALVATGFDPTPVSSYGLDFICQIQGVNGVEDPPGEDCSTTPPANAYWSFWYADSGQDVWNYSNLGAMSLQPLTGSVEAWVFGGETGGAQPSGLPTPDEVRAATTQTVTGTGTGTTTTTTTTTTATGTPPGSSSGSNPAPAPQGASTDPAPASTPSAAGGTTSTSAPTRAKLSPSPAQSAPSAGRTSPAAHGSRGSGSTSTSRPGDGERIVSAVPAVDARHPSSGPSTSFLVGAGVVLLLIAVAGTMTWVRRRERPEGL